MKLLSVAIPCYNSEAYMSKCINSLLIGGEEVEIIIVDDGSSDRTAEIADDYAEKYPSGKRRPWTGSEHRNQKRNRTLFQSCGQR